MIMASYCPQAGTSAKLDNNDSPLTVFMLPEHIIQRCLSFLAYNELSEARRVCQYFNRSCQELLTQGFSRVDRLHSLIQREVKSKLPRRESERRNHELSRHVDILSAVETRLSLLSMTYSKYIDHGLCCFIPGKVLDELFSLLGKLQNKERQLPRAHEFLQELRDISSMAMEHFEEHIIPRLKQQMPSMSAALPLALPLPDVFSPDQASPSPGLQFSTPSMRSPSLRQEMLRLQHQVRVQSSSLQSYKRELSEHKNKIMEHRKMNLEHEKKLQNHERKIQEQNRIISDQNSQIDMLQNSINNMNNRLTGICALLPPGKVKNFDISGGQSSSNKDQSSSNSKSDSYKGDSRVTRARPKRKMDSSETSSAGKEKPKLLKRRKI